MTILHTNQTTPTDTPTQTVGQRIAYSYTYQWSDKIANEIDAAIDDAVSAEREKVAAFMISRSYATGHGDTTENLLKELGEQLDERDDAVKPLISALRNVVSLAGSPSPLWDEARAALKPYIGGGE